MSETRGMQPEHRSRELGLAVAALVCGTLAACQSAPPPAPAGTPAFVAPMSPASGQQGAAPSAAAPSAAAPQGNASGSAMRPPARSATPGPMTGTYNGLITLASGSDGSCGSQDLITLQLRNGTFDYVLNQPQVPYQPQRAFHVTINPDGTFRTDQGGAFMRGVVRGGHMHGDIVGDACGYAFDADLAGTW
ncbi:MAG: hypothetical protein J0H19_24815 [Rhodospirillales bacterium]|nr:hypothetical protein [Rhodospirillales bacterium]MBN8929828.1 hypothetical protein [Rhodospirillales bacterium]